MSVLILKGSEPFFDHCQTCFNTCIDSLRYIYQDYPVTV